MPKITDRLIEEIINPESGRVFVADDEIAGFGACITRARKAFVVQYFVNGSYRRIILGRCDRLSAHEAREQARLLLSCMTTAPTSKRKTPTLGEVIDAYVIGRCLRPRTVRNYRQCGSKYFSEWLALPVTEIAPEMVLARHRELGQKYSPTTVNLAFWALRSFINFAMQEFDIPFTSNPVSILSKKRAWYRMRRRQGIVPDHKLCDWWSAVQNEASEKIRDYLLLILLTGLRRSEAASLTWNDVDFEARTLTIPATKTKNHREHVLPLTKFLVAFLTHRKKSTDSEYVFPGRVRGHIGHWLSAMNAVRQRSGCHFLIHDLRRTFTSTAAKLGIQHHLTKRLLNHIANRDETDEYIVVSTDDLRLPMESIQRRLLSLMSVDPVLWDAPAGERQTLAVKHCLLIIVD